MAISRGIIEKAEAERTACSVGGRGAMSNKENTMKTDVRGMLTDLISEASDMEELEAQALSETICTALCTLLSADKKWHQEHRGQSQKGDEWEQGFIQGIQQAITLVGGSDV